MNQFLLFADYQFVRGHRLRIVFSQINFKKESRQRADARNRQSYSGRRQRLFEQAI